MIQQVRERAVTKRWTARRARAVRRSWKTLVEWGAVAIGAAFFSGFAAFPLVFMLTGSFKSLGEIYGGIQTLLPQAPTLDNYGNVLLGNTLVQTSYPANAANSLAVAALTIGITMTVALPAALAIARQRWVLTTLLTGWVRVAQVVGGIVVIIPLYLIIRNAHLTDTLIGVSLAQSIPCSALAIWILASFVREIPVELDEAASIDGASALQVLRYVIIPLARPGIVSVVLVVFLLSWNDFLNPVILLNNPRTFTVMVSLFTYIGQVGQVQWGRLLCFSVLSVIPPLLLIVFAERHIVRGLLSGSIKE